MKVKLQEHSARISQSSEVFRHSRKVRLEDAEETARFRQEGWSGTSVLEEGPQAHLARWIESKAILWLPSH